MDISIVDLFFKVLNEIKSNYSYYGFVIERDLVWTVQKRLSKLIDQKSLPYKMSNDYPIEKGERRSKSVDLVIVGNDIQYTEILNGSASVELAIEFKFEPSKNRKDICIHNIFFGKGI